MARLGNIKCIVKFKFISSGTMEDKPNQKREFSGDTENLLNYLLKIQYNIVVYSKLHFYVKCQKNIKTSP